MPILELVDQAASPATVKIMLPARFHKDSSSDLYSSRAICYISIDVFSVGKRADQTYMGSGYNKDTADQTYGIGHISSQLSIIFSWALQDAGQRFNKVL